jgi:hypothetical protein
MMKAIIIGLGAVLLAGLVIIPLTNSDPGGSDVNGSSGIPPIDASAPTLTEKATFALG